MGVTGIPSSPSILLIESDASVSESFRCTIGHRFPDVRRDYETLLQAPLSIGYDAVICNIGMAMSDQCSIMKWCDRELPCTPFILTMVRTNEGEMEHARTQGAFDAISVVPFDSVKASIVIRRTLWLYGLRKNIANQEYRLKQYKKQLKLNPVTFRDGDLGDSLRATRSLCVDTIKCIEATLQTFILLAEDLEIEAADNFQRIAIASRPLLPGQAST